MSVHTPSRALKRVNLPDGPKTILMGHAFGTGQDDDGNSVELVASGNTIRFTVDLADGRRAQYDLDVSFHAKAAIEMAKAEA